MKFFGTMLVSVVALMAGAFLGAPDFAAAKGNKSNLGGPIEWAKTAPMDGTKINKQAVKKSRVRGTRNNATPMPLPGPR